MNDTAAKIKSPGGIKETIEQILVAFVLAFIFRCFLVEAFVIPTGSMAPTLLGAHVDYRCPDCGYEFKVNYTSPGGGELVVEPFVSVRSPTGQLVPRTLQIICPNCGYRLPRTNPGDERNQATGAPTKGGDRILVMKYQYLLNSPKRWDIVVFKADDDLQGSGRAQTFGNNYIKRLVGLPGETLMVLDGDLYVAESTKPVDQLTPADFSVRAKSPAAQQAMWRIVYDNDFQSRGLSRTYVDPVTNRSEIVDPPWANPWRITGAATAVGTRFAIDAVGKTASLAFDENVAPEKHALTDWLPYAQTSYAGPVRGNAPAADLFRINHRNFTLPVSDLKLALVYERSAGTGLLELKMSKRQDLFIARVAPDGVSILRQPLDGSAPPVELAKRVDLTRVGQGVQSRIEFCNVDYRVSLTIDGREVLATTPQQYSPDIPALLAEYGSTQLPAKSVVGITADDQTATLSHVSLWRDVYYVNRQITPQSTLGEGPAAPWASPEPLIYPNPVGRLIRLGQDEYFVLGDNTRMSADGRFWRGHIDFSRDENLAVEPGRVPKRFLIGKAFFVYWPAADRPTSYLPIGIVPDFGEMRFIR